MIEIHLDSLFCAEEKWDEQEEEIFTQNGKTPQDFSWEDEEILALFSKEQKTHFDIGIFESDSALCFARDEAVNWMFRVKDFYGFSVLTGMLGVSYLDRFLSGFRSKKEKPWMIQLVALACISLAAKVEETHVPLLLDLQVEDTKYIFEAKTIRRMELLLLSTLEWKMHPITPLSFLHHIIGRLGLKTHLLREFLRRSERLLLLLVSDSRFVKFLPSVLATATMMNVMDQIEPCNSIDYQNQLLGVLKIDKEEVNECYKLINGGSKSNKRKYDRNPDSSNDSSPEKTRKKNRVEVEDRTRTMFFAAITQQSVPRHSLPSFP